MNILDTIVAHKYREVELRKASVSTLQLEESLYFNRETLSMKAQLLRTEASGIIAEFKRKSPSKGIINAKATVESTTAGYSHAGASALSILTDEEFFGGTMEDVRVARPLNSIPILRKDFIIDEYQIVEAKSIGADVILLIAAMLDSQSIRRFCSFAHSLNLEVLMEVHNEKELQDNLDSGIDLVGVNNRDLKTFRVNIETSKRVSKIIPDSYVKISESGIDSIDSIRELKQYGFSGFLIGENFMKQQDPSAAAREFISNLTTRKEDDKK